MLATGCVYPPLDDIRNVSAIIAADVADNIIATGRATKFTPSNISTLEYCRSLMYTPSY